MTSPSGRRPEITSFGPLLLPSLTRLANSHLRAIPPGNQLTPEQVEAVLSEAPGFWRLRYPDLEQAAQEILCVNDMVRLGAAARVTYIHPSPGSDHGATRLEAHLNWIFADPDDEEALGLLVDELIARAARRGCGRLLASTRCDFGLGWFNLPADWPHLIRGLQRAGFETVDRWTMLTSGIHLPEPASDPPIRRRELHWEVGEFSHEWKLEARRDGAVIGECEAWGAPPYLASAPGYREWTTIERIHVAEPYRRRGLGRFLLQEQLRAQAERGVKHVMVWSESGDLAVRRFWGATGFTPRSECWRLAKTLG